MPEITFFMAYWYYMGIFFFFAGIPWLADLLNEEKFIIKGQIAFFDWMDFQDILYSNIYI